MEEFALKTPGNPSNFMTREAVTPELRAAPERVVGVFLAEGFKDPEFAATMNNLTALLMEHDTFAHDRWWES
jgi:hypothetical protein